MGVVEALVDTLIRGWSDDSSAEFLLEGSAFATVRFIVFYDAVANPGTQVIRRHPDSIGPSLALNSPGEELVPVVVRHPPAKDDAENLVNDRDDAHRLARQVVDQFGEPDGAIFRVDEQHDADTEHFGFDAANWCAAEMISFAPAVPEVAEQWLRVLMDAMYVPSWWSLLLRLVGSGLDTIAVDTVLVRYDSTDGTIRIGDQVFATYSSAIAVLAALPVREISLTLGDVTHTFSAPTRIVELESLTPLRKWNAKAFVGAYSQPLRSFRNGPAESSVQAAWIRHGGRLFPFVMAHLPHIPGALSLQLAPSPCSEPARFRSCVSLTFTDVDAHLDLLTSTGGCRRFGVSGTALLQLAIDTARALGAKVMSLQDAAVVPCKKAVLSLALVSVWRLANTWYGSHGFVPDEGRKGWARALAFLRATPIRPAMDLFRASDTLRSNASIVLPALRQTLATLEETEDERVADLGRRDSAPILEALDGFDAALRKRATLSAWAFDGLDPSTPLGDCMTRALARDCMQYGDLVETLTNLWPAFADAVERIETQKEAMQRKLV